MLDNRKAMTNGYKLVLGNNSQYTITEELGRGAGCIIYNAIYPDSTGCRHIVRIKECYPYNMEISRLEDGTLKVAEPYKTAFADAKIKFRDAYSKNVALKNTLGLINSTVDVMDIYEYGNTLYSVMGCIEGEDYRRDLDENIQSLFIRLLALARIIKKYHDNGVLYLDIKPENIMVIPETKEHMVLFDFDSILFRESLRNNKETRISFSDGYAAPELVQGKINKICEATDIYSIGAIAFYKLFGRTPGPMEGAINFKYDFNTMLQRDERYQPEFFRLLDKFLHKTVASSVAYRYQKIDEMVTVLKELIEVSDISSTFLFHNFSYDSSYFVGRGNEINSINRVFESGQKVLFLSGIGGIGKTELAKRYAYENASKYKKIVFVPFAGSIMETVCGNDLHINKISQGEDEKDTDYYKRKLGILRKSVSIDDLIILDNFDIESDENLEDLLECQCRFLVTSREDFRDYEYEQIDVGRIEDIDEILKLFRVYNKREYSQEEVEQIKDIIEIIDRHTMTAGLIAKYLRTTDESPGEFLESLMKKEGIANTKDINIRHKKDRRLRIESINQHLLVLFDLSGFSEPGCELIRSLSLMGYVRISKKKFLEYCPVSNCINELDNLIHKGWIEYNEVTGKISLHQIILDLVYNNLAPDAGNCPLVTASMTDYILQEMANYSERHIRDKLLGYFMQRIRGNNIEYAKLCIYYCENIKKEEKYLDAAEEICLLHNNSICYKFLQMIYHIKTKIIVSYDNILWNNFWNNVMDNDFDEYSLCKQMYIKVSEYSGKAIYYAEKYNSSADYMGEFCVTLAEDINSESNDNICMLVLSEDNKYLNKLFDLIVSLHGQAENYILESGLNNKDKEKLFRRIQKFYVKDVLSTSYIYEKYIDTKKTFYYQEIIELLKDSNNKFVYDDVGYVYLAKAAEEKGNHKKAIELYYKAYERSEGSYDEILKAISDIYLKTEDINNAIGCLWKILDINKEKIVTGDNHNVYYSNICYDLINLLIENNEITKAKEYIEELIYYNIEDIEDEAYSYNIQWILLANYKLYLIETSIDEKEEYWKNCLYYFSMFNKEEKYPENIKEFLVELADQQEEDKDKIETAFKYLDSTNTLDGTDVSVYFLEYIIKICGTSPDNIYYYIKALIYYSRCLFDPYTKPKEALDFCLKAKAIYEANNIDNEYLYNIIYKALEECYSDSNSSYEEIAVQGNECNYYLIAERESKEIPVEKQIDIWKDAAIGYNYLDNYIMEEKCYIKIFEIFMPLFGKYKFTSFSNYDSIKQNQINCYIKQRKYKETRNLVMDYYNNTVIYFLEQTDKEDIYADFFNDDFYWYLGQCAECMYDSQWYRESFVFYILSIITLVDPNQEKSLFDNIENYILGKWDTLFNIFSNIIHGEIINENIDIITNIYEDLVPLFEKDIRLQEFHTELKWFISVYQDKDIEFKR